MFTGGASVIAPTVSSANAALIGDSLTDDSFGITPFYWMNGILGGGLKVVANSGKAGHKVSDVLARVDNSYAALSPGLAGLGSLGYVFVRIGTNDAVAGTAIAGTLAGQYDSLMAKLAGYADRVVVLSVPPLSDSSQNALTQAYNSYLQANYNSGQFKFVDDCVNMRDGSGNQIPAYFVDGIHFGGQGDGGNGVYQAGVDGAAALSSYIGSYASPLVTDAADVYPATPQWFTNPTMLGTSGTTGTGISGTVVTGLDVSRSASGAAATCSVVSADVGDPNTTPWQRIAPTQGSTSTSVKVTSTLNGRSITSGDPASLDVVMQLRFNSFDPNQEVDYVRVYVTGDSDGEAMSDARLRMLFQTPPISRTVTFRNAVPRTAGANQTGAKLHIDINFPSFGSFGPAGSIGSIDIRCISVRG